MHNARTGSAPTKSDKPTSRDCSAAASPVPESRCAPVDKTSDCCDPPPKSKGKSVKLKKNVKTENSKKLIRQVSKDSVVLVGYKNLKASYSDTSTKYKEGEAPLNQEEERDNLFGATSSYLRTNADSIFESGATSGRSLNSALDSVIDDNITASFQKGFFDISANYNAENKPQAGTEVFSRCSQSAHKEEQFEQSGRKLPHWSTGLKTETKPSIKDPHQVDTVTDLPHRTDIRLTSNHPEIAQRDMCDSEQTVVDSVFERPVKETAQRSQPCLISIQAKGDCIRLPDGVRSASSRLSDSGIESEPSSFAAQLFPGLQTCVGVGIAELSEKPSLSPIPRIFQQSSMQKSSGVAEIPENTSAVSGVQSSLTSINSLPSDDECEGSSKSVGGTELCGRKSSILVQEQSLVFSGEGIDLVGIRDSQFLKPAILDAELGLAGASSSGTIKDCHSEPPTACPSSNSATSSTDLVKRGMVENYFGSRSSTDVSEISPVETSAITLGIQAEPQVREDEDETEHEMIENGYYEEGDGYAFVNGITEEGQSGVGDAGAHETSVLFEQLGVGYLHETKDLSKAPICSNIPSSCVGHSLGRPLCLSAHRSFSLQWYECAPTPQMKA